MSIMQCVCGLGNILLLSDTYDKMDFFFISKIILKLDWQYKMCPAQEPSQYSIQE